MGTRVEIHSGAPKDAKGTEFVTAAIMVRERGAQRELIFTGPDHASIRLKPEFMPYYNNGDNEDGFIIANSRELFFVNRAQATSMARQLNIKMANSVLSTDDLWKRVESVG